MKVIYHGHEVMTYVNYIDAVTGKTLVCEPGRVYDILPDVMPTDGRFTEVIAEEVLSEDIPAPDVTKVISSVKD